jgi:hypothetical protein
MIAGVFPGDDNPNDTKQQDWVYEGVLDFMYRALMNAPESALNELVVFPEHESPSIYVPQQVLLNKVWGELNSSGDTDAEIMKIHSVWNGVSTDEYTFFNTGTIRYPCKHVSREQFGHIINSIELADPQFTKSNAVWTFDESASDKILFATSEVNADGDPVSFFYPAFLMAPAWEEWDSNNRANSQMPIPTGWDGMIFNWLMIKWHLQNQNLQLAQRYNIQFKREAESLGVYMDIPLSEMGTGD